MKFDSGRYDDVLKSLRQRFIVVSVLLFAVAMVCVYQIRTRRLLEKTHKELVRAQDGLRRVTHGIENRTQTLATLKSQFVKDGFTQSTAQIVYRKMDDILVAYKPDEFSIGSLEKKGSDVSLPFTLKFTGTDYNRFLTIISELQRGTYPISQVSSLSIVQTSRGGKNGLLFTIMGSITSIEKSLP